MKLDFSLKLEPSKKEKEVFQKVKRKVKSVTDNVISFAKEKAEEVADAADVVRAESLKNEYFAFGSDKPFEKMEPEELYNYIIEATKNSKEVEFDILSETETTFTYVMKVEKLPEKEEYKQCNNCPCKKDSCMDCEGPECFAGKY